MALTNTKVIKSLAEILFYNWNDIDKGKRSQLMTYLSSQANNSIAKVVEISSKFARVYEYCDFLYEQRHIEHASCKSQYWQPLSDL